MRILRSILFVIIGFCLILDGADVLNKNKGEAGLSQTYGGDAYTGIQNAQVQTGRLIILQSEIISYGLGWTMISGGLALIVCAIPVNIQKKKED